MPFILQLVNIPFDLVSLVSLSYIPYLVLYSDDLIVFHLMIVPGHALCPNMEPSMVFQDPGNVLI